MNRAQDEGSSAPKPPGRKAGMKMGRAYQAAFEATIAVVVAGAAGGYADQKLGTTPMLLIAGVLLGFGTFVLRLVRLLNELNPKPKAEQETGASPGRDAGDE
jgi:F0F1-type ATP synthase assembly protein I